MIYHDTVGRGGIGVGRWGGGGQEGGAGGGQEWDGGGQSDTGRLTNINPGDNRQSERERRWRVRGVCVCVGGGGGEGQADTDRLTNIDPNLDNRQSGWGVGGGGGVKAGPELGGCIKITNQNMIKF